MRFLVLLLIAACARPLEKLVRVDETPAFLDDASGLYLNRTDGANESSNINVIALAGKLIAAPPSANGGEGNSFTIVGDLREEDGKRVVETQATLPVNDMMSVTVNARFVLGFDAADITFSTLDGQPGFLPCSGGELGVSCVFSTAKLCDFDSRLAGVFAATLALDGSEGDCSTVSAFPDGQRQLSLTVVNSTSESSIVSLNNGEPEFAALLVFDHATQALSLNRSLPVQNAAAWAAGSQVTGSVGSSDDQVTLSLHLVRTEGACTQRYTLSGTRKSGTKRGVSCPVSAGNGCATKTVECPVLPEGLDVEQVTRIGNDNLGCPQSVCSARIPGSSLCDGVSRQVAALGCGAGQAIHLQLAEGAQGGRCLTMRCEDDSECGGRSYGSQGAIPCGKGDTVDLTATNGCLSSRCTARDALCTRAPPCGDALGIPSSLVSPGLDPQQCPTIFCALDPSLSLTNYFGQDRATLDTTLSMSYKIDNFSPALFSGMKSFPHLGPGSCPPVDLNLLTMACPSVGWRADRCVDSSTPFSTQVSNRLVLHQRQNDLCLGVYNVERGVLLSGGGFAPVCAPGKVNCCDTPVGDNLSVGCHPAKGPQNLALGGHVRGDPGGLLLTTATDSRSLSAGEAFFSFGKTLPSGAGFTVTASNAWCSVHPSSGTIGSTDFLSLNVQCGFKVMGFVNTPVTLTLDTLSGDHFDLPASGSFEFPAVLGDGEVFTLGVSGPTSCSTGTDVLPVNGQTTGADRNFNVTCP